MGFIKTNFDCNNCGNKDYCPEPIKARTIEVRNALESDTLPVEFIKQRTLPWIEMNKSCAIEKKKTTLEEIKKEFTGEGTRRPVIEWFSCSSCEKQNDCWRREFTESWLRDNRSEIENNLIRPSISAPWIDSQIVCTFSPKHKPKVIGFRPNT